MPEHIHEIASSTNLFLEIWKLLSEMSPYLMLGFFMAGLLHVIIPDDILYKHLSSRKFSSVLKATIFGIPLPLCSCGVIPVAAHLKKQGASNGSVISFLSSTPTTGVDSILATYSLMGPLFAIIRPVAAFFQGILSGSMANIIDKSVPDPDMQKNSINQHKPHLSLKERIKKLVKYGFYELPEDVGKWILIGVVIGGLISYLVPQSMIEKYLGNQILAYPLMLAIGIPMYVCATGSIPIAASLIAKGMTPGAAIVFLIAGPATNTATLSFIGGKLGRKLLLIYTAIIIVVSVLTGLFIDFMWIYLGKDPSIISGGSGFLSDWMKNIFSLLLIIIIIIPFFKIKKKELLNEMGFIVKVPDMTCSHCKTTIEHALRKVEGVKDIKIDLNTKQVEIIGDANKEKIYSAIEKSGYTVEK